MSMGQLARNRAMSMGSGRSTGRQASLADFNMTHSSAERDFEPCDATASMFLYAQGSSIVVAHHDTLNVERRFTKHTEQVHLLAVDNVSERGAGRLVISYDAGQTAIVWDLMTGDEIARFASYTDLSVSAWMRNGNVAFGNGHGNVILFEPTTSEHISSRTIDQIPITALAPASDCRTYAIGYKNGSILICVLQPRFTILHNLSTSRAPSPIVTLAWHASSSKQKSDMLATQTKDGDLRVWSVSKANYGGDTAKVVRVLKRSGDFQDGPNWLGWSKGGRIIQFSNGETASWDVRTKHVTYEPVPTLDHVRGMAIFGPGATLFTLGRNHTAQQFDLTSPPLLVANVQHPVNLLPPSPPVSIEEQKKSAASGTLSAIPINVDISESDEEHMSPLARIAREMDKIEERQQMPERASTLSPASSQSSYQSHSSAAAYLPLPHASRSARSAGRSDHTIMSAGSSLHSRETSIISSRDSLSLSSMSTSSHKSRPRPSRLRQEVIRSPEDKVIVELFKFTKSRLSDIPHKTPQVPSGTSKPVAELRRIMLNTIFGWEGEAEGLIRDELSRHAHGSQSSLLLTKWLGDIDTDIMATSSQSMTSSDWMLLALSGIGGQASQHKVARAYVQRLLEKGDVHTAATIMIGMGDQNDAVEIYVSHKRYMEALILSCFVYPNDWGRQTQLIRKWGEWAVQHSQQQLAIRCFSCTSSEPAEPYLSPPPQASSFAQRGFPELLSPPLSPPGLTMSPPAPPKSPPGVVPRGPQRNMARAAALKLVTSFDEKHAKSKFFGADETKTPHNGVGATPIAESALSPYGGDQTAFLRSQRSVFGTPVSATARTATPGGFSRQRLPSIGEMPTDVTPMVKKLLPSYSGDSGSELSGRSVGSLPKRSGRSHSRKKSQPETVQINSASQVPGSRSANASPMLQKENHGRVLNPLPAPSPQGFTAEKASSRARNGSRDRKPVELQIQSGWPAMESILTGDYMTTPEYSSASARHPTPTTHSVTGSAGAGSISSTGASHRGRRNRAIVSPVIGRSIDDYISSLEVAQASRARPRARTSSRDPNDERSRRARSSSNKPRTREPSEDRGRPHGRYMKPKRSPTSPVPMSPDELNSISATGADDNQSEITSRRRHRDNSEVTLKPSSKPSSRTRRQSPESTRSRADSRTGSRTAMRTTSRKTSPEPRGRSKARTESTKRSPSSPLPMSAQAKLYKDDPVDEVDVRAARVEQHRLRSRQRSNSRGMKERSRSAAGNASPDRRRRDESHERRDEIKRIPRSASHTRSASDMKAGDLHQIKLDRQRKKEAAAWELEERRRSLARRPSAPPIVHPEQLSPATFKPSSKGDFFKESTNNSSLQSAPQSHNPSPDATKSQDGGKSPSGATTQVGLPATPRAMQHPKFDPENKDIPDVPQIPESYSQAVMERLDHLKPDPLFDLGPLPKTTFAPLPKTTYQIVPRHVPPRSMSAPIPEEPTSPKHLPASLPTHPAFHAALPPSTRRRNIDAGADERVPSVSRKASPIDGTISFETRNLVIGGIDATIEAHSPNPLNNLSPPPPPPPPAPPILKELQHLALPPPPPPPPLYRIVSRNHQPVSPPAPKSALIEIVMDDDVPAAAPPSKRNSPPEPSPPLPPPPPPNRKTPPQASERHSRGPSQNDNSLSGRISRATERMRSASRGASPTMTRVKTPTVHQSAPYESIPPTAVWVADQVQNRAQYSSQPVQEVTTERHPRDVKAQMMEGSRAQFSPQPVQEVTTERHPRDVKAQMMEGSRAQFSPQPVQEVTTERHPRDVKAQMMEGSRAQFSPQPVQEVTTERHPRDVKAQMMEGGMI